MKTLRPAAKIFCLFLFCCSSVSVLANNPAYQQRQADYVTAGLANFNSSALTLQAYAGVPLDSATLTVLLTNISANVTSDFDIVQMVRILYFTNGAYDAEILPALHSVPYWINYGDTVRNYWSENHMIMWMSSDWLLHEKYGRPVDSTLNIRLRHYLELKVQYGYYEFFSSVYAPYALTGLLNLADFAQDIQIKNLATQAAQRLLKDLLMLTNDKGVYFPVAGRNYPGKYESAYGQNHNNLIYLLTGLGIAPTNASHAGGFLASSSLPVDSVIASWTPQLDIIYHIGHTLDSGFVINSAMSAVDKVVFQWSSGAYFHPDVAQQTVQLLVDSNLWRHVDFELLRPLSFLSPESAPTFATTMSVLSKSSVYCGQDVALFKNNSVTLSSVSDYWKGKVGFQQHPCVANVGTTAVYTASGEVKPDWEDRNENIANEHLPYVQQKSNLALLMYRPEPIPALLASRFTHKDVALHWHDADFDEVEQDGFWLLGRQRDSYVAVRRNCIGEINGVRACPTVGGQAWAIMVGDSAMYGGFMNFRNMIHQAQFTETWYYDTLNAQSVYYAKVEADTLSIEYAWGVDSVATGMEPAANNAIFRLYPNPASSRLTIDLSMFRNQSVGIRALNILGQEVYREHFSVNHHYKSLPAENWNSGTYLIIVESLHRLFTQKLIVIK